MFTLSYDAHHDIRLDLDPINQDLPGRYRRCFVFELPVLPAPLNRQGTIIWRQIGWAVVVRHGSSTKTGRGLKYRCVAKTGF